MSLSKEERERIERFVAMPRHERTPDQLCPESDGRSAREDDE
ncbi:hypothetical protein [Halorussus halophilus]|nr:hypothetical protein [Halorussus halophilus]